MFWTNLGVFILLLVGVMVTEPFHTISWAMAILLLLFLSHQNYKQGRSDVQREFLSQIPPVLASQTRSVSEMGMEISKIWVELERMQSVLDTIHEGVLAIDDEGRILIHNQNAERLLETSLYGHRLEEVHIPKKIHKLLKNNKDGVEWLWKKGAKPNRQYILCSCVSWGYGGLLVLRDITKIRQLERVRRDFFANVSHELKTPIAIIQAHAEALADGAYLDTKMAPVFLAALVRNSERLNLIISSMLDLANLEAGTYNLQLTVQAVRPLVEQCIDLQQDAAKKKGHKLYVEYMEELQAYIDVRAFEHIVNNFIQNAIKYTPNDGEIRVRVEESAGMTKISVSDNGPGIEPKYHGRVFERFFRVDKGRTRSEGGTGLGLSIVRNFADSMEAEVGVGSSELGGAEFWCLLPQSTL